jgi:hypothetical protein
MRLTDWFKPAAETGALRACERTLRHEAHNDHEAHQDNFVGFVVFSDFVIPSGVTADQFYLESQRRAPVAMRRA